MSRLPCFDGTLHNKNKIYKKICRHMCKETRKFGRKRVDHFTMKKSNEKNIPQKKPDHE